MPVTTCAPPTFTPGIVQYSPAEFLAAYPEFTGTYNASPSSLANDFVGATFLLNNTCCSRVQDANQRMFLLYLLTAHIAAIHQGSNDGGVLNPAASFVGSVAGNTLSVSALSGGALAVGSVLYDGPSVGSSLLVAGTTITALGSGTGGIGTYTVNGGAQTVASESMIVAGVPNVVQPLGIVGRINNASEGDVSLTSEWSAPPSASQAYFIQTKYGADYWTYTAPYRTALFIRAPQDAYNPLAAYGLGPWGPGRGL